MRTYTARMSELPSTPTETMGPRSPSAALGRPVDMGYLEGTIGYTIRRAQLAVFQDIYREFGDTRITLTQFSVMAVAADNPEVTQAELAEVLAVERPRIVPILNALEARGLAKRLVCDIDRRNRRIVLTVEGLALLQDLKRRFAVHEARLDQMLGVSKRAMLLALQELGGLSAQAGSAGNRR